MQTYSSCVRTSTHRHREEPSTCSSRRYFSATSAAWNWLCGGAGLAAGLGGDGAAASRSASAGDAARSSLLSPATGADAGLLSRSGNSSDGDPGSITTLTLSRYTDVHTHTTLKTTRNYDEMDMICNKTQLPLERHISLHLRIYCERRSYKI